MGDVSGLHAQDLSQESKIQKRYTSTDQLTFPPWYN
jgi:hypothetical protein